MLPDPKDERVPYDRAAERLPYSPPALEPLGPWRALTLQQSIPIGPDAWWSDSLPYYAYRRSTDSRG
jgi:hypothetical protein